MANPFDDLIPAQNAGSFDDLIPKRSTGEKTSRLVGQFAQNANDAIASTLGLPVDLLTAGLQKVGLYPDGSPTIKGVVGEQVTGQKAAPPPAPLGGAQSIKTGIDYVATLPGRIADALSQGSLAPLADSRSSRFDPENRGEKVAAGMGTGFGSLAATLLPAAAVARTAQAGSVTQRVAEALASQPVLQGVSALTGGAATGATDNPYVGLAASLAVPLGASAARSAISPVTNRLNPAEQAIVAAAAREGIPLTPAQQTGSGVLRGFEETVSRLPGGGAMKDAYAGQREQLNRAIMVRAGETATDASPATMRNAYARLGQQFDDLASRTVLNADTRLAADLGAVEQQYGRRLPTDVASVFRSYMDDMAPLLRAIQGGQNPQIAGDIYKSIRSDLATRIRNTNDPDLKMALGGIVKALDDAVSRSTSGGLAREWADTRGQYAALKTIDKAMQGGTQADRAAGNIPLGAFSSAVRGADKGGYTRARGQMGDLAKIADFLAQRIPNSGTPERIGWGQLLTGGGLLGSLASGGGSTPQALTHAAIAAGATVGGPFVASQLYNTGVAQRYLTNQVAGRTNFAPLLAAEAERQAVQSEDRRMKELALILMRANEQGAR